jgi:hypothetical protein
MGWGRKRWEKLKNGELVFRLSANVAKIGEWRIGKRIFCGGRAVDIVIRFPDTATLKVGMAATVEVQAKECGR